MPHFLICIHDATPAFARETERIIRDLEPLVGRRLTFGVVPNWHGAWPLAAHPDYCRLVRDAAGEVLLHGYDHRRERGRGLVSWIANGCDEMNGLNFGDTHRAVERGQQAMTEAFGAPARGFLAPGWQRGLVHGRNVSRLGLEYSLGFLAIETPAGRRIPLATSTWDCGRWAWLGHAGHGTGRVLRLGGRRCVSLAIHPADLVRGFWPRILQLVHRLLERGHAPATPAELLQVANAQAAL